ncbi:hypothetical protein [Sphingomonas hengshuiensis]|uniref:hypothetical protein n=1 Tax=Sphingomonas hengshuiensis TaxID=1609977 RepID=UPI0005C9EF28|nr:hypothetical protein [Sphingomonas hengshuiensis]
MRLTLPHLCALAAALLLATAPSAASAYTGPGLGFGAIGVAFGLIGSLLLAIASLVWYPVKRVLRRVRGAAKRRER